MHIRAFGVEDAEPSSALIVRNAREINSADYDPGTIERIVAYFTSAELIDLALDREVVVADVSGQVVGTVSLEGNRVYTMFVDPDFHGRGIGRALMRHIETRAYERGLTFVETGASITARGFYRELGFHDVCEIETAFGLNYLMRKQLTIVT